MTGQYDSKVGGYIAKAEDIQHAHSYEEVVETLRLDYRDTAFTEGGKSYGLIKYQAVKPEKIRTPYGKDFVEAAEVGGKGEPPFTQNGFTAARNGEVIPEWNAPRALPKEAELYRVVDGKEELVGIYDADDKMKFITPKEYLESKK